MDPRFAEGVRLFDEGAYFEAHEAWEACWREAVDADARLLYQGLVQVTAAFHKRFVARDAASAERLLGRGLAKLEKVVSASELDLDLLRPALRRCLEAHVAVTPEDVPRIAPLLRGP